MSSEAGPRTIPDYREQNLHEPYIRTDVPSLKDIATRRLSDVERATVRVKALPTGAVPPGRSVLLESAARLAIFGLRGHLEYLSGARLAKSLEIVYFTYPSRDSARGYWLLSEIDRLGYGQVWVDAEPSPDHPMRHRRMRLHERVDELAAPLLTSA